MFTIHLLKSELVCYQQNRPIVGLHSCETRRQNSWTAGLKQSCADNNFYWPIRPLSLFTQSHLYSIHSSWQHVVSLTFSFSLIFAVSLSLFFHQTWPRYWQITLHNMMTVHFSFSFSLAFSVSLFLFSCVWASSFSSAQPERRRLAERVMAWWHVIT